MRETETGRELGREREGREGEGARTNERKRRVKRSLSQKSLWRELTVYIIFPLTRCVVIPKGLFPAPLC